MKTQLLNENLGSLFLMFQNGDEDAFDLLFRKYYPTLCAYANRFVALEDAEEIVQDVMLWLYQNKESFVAHSSLDSYLFKMIYNRSLNKISQREVKRRVDNYYFENKQDVFQDIDLCQVTELSRRLQDIIKNLPDKYKEAFIMHRFRDMSYKEIAQQLNVSSKTIDYRIQKALKILRCELKDYMFLFLLFPMLSAMM